MKKSLGCSLLCVLFMVGCGSEEKKQGVELPEKSPLEPLNAPQEPLETGTQEVTKVHETTLWCKNGEVNDSLGAEARHTVYKIFEKLPYDLFCVEKEKKALELKVLDLSYKNISDITPLLRMKNLEELLLNNNNISSISSKETLSSLYFLDLSNNQINSLNDSFFVKSKLKELHLSENQIKYTHLNLTQYENLEKLDLSGNPLKELDFIDTYSYNDTKLINIYISSSFISSESFDFEKERPFKIIDKSPRQKSVSTGHGIPPESSIIVNPEYPVIVYPDDPENIAKALKALPWCKADTPSVIDEKKYNKEQLRTINTIIKKINKDRTEKETDCSKNVSSFYYYNRWLNLDQEYLVDLSPIKGNDKLEHLSLQDNYIEDISFLEGLSNLTSLNLSQNKIESIKAISSLKKLESLDLRNNYNSDPDYSNIVEDISPLSGLTELGYLNLDNLSIKDIKPLKTLKKLTVLSLCSNKIENTKEELHDIFKNLTNISWINIHSPTDTTFLAYFKNLSYMNIHGENITSLDFLTKETYPNLTSLSISGEMETLIDFKNFPKLEELSIYSKNSKLTDISALEKAPQTIKDIYISYAHLKEIPTFSKMTNLMRLGLQNSQIEDVSSLKDLVWLKNLSLESNKIKDVSPLGNLDQIEYLKLSDNDITKGEETCPTNSKNGMLNEFCAQYNNSQLN